MENKYQFIIFMQDSNFNDIENEIKEFFGIDEYTYCFQYKEELEKAIEILSQWDNGEYCENPISYEQFRYEIGTSADIYYSKISDYVLVTYGFHSAIGLYRKIID